MVSADAWYQGGCEISMGVNRKQPGKRGSPVYSKPYWFDRARSLSELYGWPRREADGPGLVGRHTAAVNKPVGQLDAGELALLFGQQTDPHFLVPVALERVRAGDAGLLRQLVTLDPAFWVSHPHLHGEVVALAQAAVQGAAEPGDEGLADSLAGFVEGSARRR